MSRLILLRIATLALAVLAIALALVAWQAQRDVEHEARSAQQLARLFEAVSRMQVDPVSDGPWPLRDIDAMLASGEIRHLRVSIRDSEGRELLAPPPPRESPVQSWLFAQLGRLLPEHDEPPVTWTLLTQGGKYYRVTLTSDPRSEQREALTGIADTLTVLCLFGLLVVLATYLSLRQMLRPLQGILRAIDGYRRHDYRRRAPPANTAEMGAISDALNHLADELEQMQQARRHLSLKLLTLQEDERAHLARELHDEFGQALTAIRADAAWLAQRLREQPELLAVADELRGQCDRASAEVRELLRRLRPRDGGGHGASLRGMLEELLDGWRSRPGIDAHFALRFDDAVGRLPESLTLTLYRVSQEALTNAARHAGARSVSLELRRDGDGTLHWEARDDGVGMDAHAPPGNGLAGMRERVWAHGGEIAFAAATPGAARPGLRIHAWFPPAGQANAATAAGQADAHAPQNPAFP